VNLFILDLDLRANAEAHVDSHVVKMPLEAAQLACTALHANGVTAPYKPTHRNHPCAVWTRATRMNFIWTCEYGLALCREYNFRYGKFHKCAEVLRTCLWQYEAVPLGEQTPFAIAISPPHRIESADPVSQYRHYYNHGKRHLAKWSGRTPPAWYIADESAGFEARTAETGSPARLS
jgi:hypothetical protein